MKPQSDSISRYLQAVCIMFVGGVAFKVFLLSADGLSLVTTSYRHTPCSEAGAWLSLEGEIGSMAPHSGVQSIIRLMRLLLLEVVSLNSWDTVWKPNECIVLNDLKAHY